MRKMAIALLALGLVAWTSAFAANPLRISQVYGGGGNSGAYYRYDYVELFNSSSSPVDIGGWSIVYATATGTSFANTAQYRVTFPAGATIPACGYYLIQCAAGANTGAQPLPVTPDAVGTTAMSATACKIGLISSGTSATCASTFVDLVSVASSGCWEGSAPTGATSNSTAAVRKLGGVTDTDNNSADFSILACNATLPIHNSASSPNPDCAPPPTGACCLRYLNPGDCITTTAADCAARPGIYLGDGAPCDPGICATPAIRTTWGRIKTIYR